ncbi:MAG: amidohydrolase family protein [Clostridia bacterium]|nr:amidohydrolase family protein [Clostridia bacterium]
MVKMTAILAGEVLAGENLRKCGPSCVLVRDGRILDIISPAEYEAVKNESETIDLGSATLLPGLFECHNHLALDAGLEGHLGMMELSECEHTVLALNGLKKDLLSGVTTARCMGDRNYIDVKIKQMIADGRVEGPDLLVCGIGMRARHGHGFVGLPHSGVEEFRRTCRENMYRKVDHLKIFMTPGTPAASPEEFIPCFITPEEVATAVSEAKSMDIRTTAHCVGGRGLDICIRQGIDVIDHLYSVTAEQIKALENDFGGWVDMTSGIVLDEGREAFTPPAQNVKMRKARPYSTECINRVYQSGKVRFTLGTDAYHGMLYKEVEYAVAGGASTLNALKAVTVNAAEMTGLSKEKGRIAAGYTADLLAVRGDPLEDPHALSQVQFVMKHGKTVRLEEKA